jgi:hypothetical protein
MIVVYNVMTMYVILLWLDQDLYVCVCSWNCFMCDVINDRILLKSEGGNVFVIPLSKKGKAPNPTQVRGAPLTCKKRVQSSNIIQKRVRNNRRKYGQHYAWTLFRSCTSGIVDCRLWPTKSWYAPILASGKWLRNQVSRIGYGFITLN